MGPAFNVGRQMMFESVQLLPIFGLITHKTGSRIDYGRETSNVQFVFKSPNEFTLGTDSNELEESAH